jgi:hypothetical protein
MWNEFSGLVLSFAIAAMFRVGHFRMLRSLNRATVDLIYVSLDSDPEARRNREYHDPERNNNRYGSEFDANRAVRTDVCLFVPNRTH